VQQKMMKNSWLGVLLAPSAQGDKIGRNFRLLGECLLRQLFLKITEVGQTFGPLSATIQAMYLLFMPNMGLATLWANFSKTHRFALINTTIQARY
jgi:hypothetical protein